MRGVKSIGEKTTCKKLERFALFCLFVCVCVCVCVCVKVIMKNCIFDGKKCVNENRISLNSFTMD